MNYEDLTIQITEEYNRAVEERFKNRKWVGLLNPDQHDYSNEMFIILPDKDGQKLELRIWVLERHFGMVINFDTVCDGWVWEQFSYPIFFYDGSDEESIKNEADTAIAHAVDCMEKYIQWHLNGR
ncbi:hypothetical protein ACOSYY_20125 [Nitrospira sp. BLG_2]